MDVLRRAAELVREGRAVALATVVRTSGSTPRHPGARMIVGEDGSTEGTIGGGRVEKEVTDAAAAVAAGAPASLVRHHLVRDLAMCCGGTMELYVAPAAPSVAALERVAELQSRRRPALLVTPLDGAPMSVDEVAGAPAGPSSRVEDGRFVELLMPPARLLLFGCGHVARAVGPLARGVGFEVVVCDDGETGELDRAPAWAHRVIASFDPAEVEGELAGLGPGDYVVVVTRDHAVDQRILERLLPRLDLTYLGVIGSRGKVARFEKRLAARGLVTPERWSRLRAPIGLDIAAETPEEIAVSIVAELVAVKNRGGLTGGGGA
jgi:xanthine dehydrogenase accessory factor